MVCMSAKGQLPINNACQMQTNSLFSGVLPRRRLDNRMVCQMVLPPRPRFCRRLLLSRRRATIPALAARLLILLRLMEPRYEARLFETCCDLVSVGLFKCAVRRGSFACHIGAEDFRIFRCCSFQHRRHQRGCSLGLDWLSLGIQVPSLSLHVLLYCASPFF